MAYKKFVSFWDSHGDMADEEACSAAFDFIDAFKPHIRVAGGDHFDFRAIRKGACPEERRDSMRNDVRAGKEFLERLKPNYYLRGNHSFAKGTELLTEEGWKPVDQLTLHDRVGQFDLETKAISFSAPEGLVSHREAFIYTVEGRYTKQSVSSKHHVVLGSQKYFAEDLLGQSINEKAISISGKAPIRPTQYSLDNIRLLTWVIMDGCIVDNARYVQGSTKIRIQFKLSKQRKIDRLRALLERLGVEYTFALCKKSGINKLQPFYIRIYGSTARRISELLYGEKQIPKEWAYMGREALDVFLEELSHTDGSIKDAHISWSTTSKHDVDVVQMWSVLSAYSCAVRPYVNRSGFSNAKLQFLIKLSPRHTDTFSSDLSITKTPYHDTVYCVTMPLGTVISRIDGKVAFTGNCERLWELAQLDNGLESDYAKLGVADIEKLCSKMRTQMFPYNKRDGIVRLGHLKIIHGFFCGVGAARRTAQVYGACLAGHSHSIQHNSIEGLESRMGRICGCLCKLEMGYNARSPGTLAWQHGWAYGLIHDDGSYQVFQAEKCGGKWLLPTGFKEL